MSANGLTLQPLGGSNMDLIQGRCRQCLHWEDPSFWTSTLPAEMLMTRKQAWFASVAQDFAPCGMAGLEGDEVVAFAQYAPPERFAGLKEYDVPAEAGVPFIACLTVAPDWRRKGVGTTMLGAIEKDTRERGFTRLQAYARKDNSTNPAGPLEFWLSNGYTVAKEGAEFALVTKSL